MHRNKPAACCSVFFCFHDMRGRAKGQCHSADERQSTPGRCNRKDRSHQLCTNRVFFMICTHHSGQNRKAFSILWKFSDLSMRISSSNPQNYQKIGKLVCTNHLEMSICTQSSNFASWIFLGQPLHLTWLWALHLFLAAWLPLHTENWFPWRINEKRWSDLKVRFYNKYKLFC